MPEAWPLVGREGEVNWIAAALERTHGRGVLISGDAGVGKTRLALEALAWAAARGSRTGWAVGTAAAGSVPFGALAHLLPAAIPSRPTAANLLRTLAEAIVPDSGSRGLVLGIDDAHLLDAGSSALVDLLARTGRVSLVMTMRAEHSAPDAVVRLWKDGLVERRDIGELSRRSADELLERILRDQVEGPTRHRLWKLARGNPLFLTELIRAGLENGALAQSGGVWRWEGSEPGPRLKELVQARIGRLSIEERSILEQVAIGEPLPIEALPTDGAPALEALERRHLVVEPADGRRVHLALAHPMYGDVVRAMMPPARVREVTRALAAALGAMPTQHPDDLLRLARWDLDSGIGDRPDVLAAAADRALRLGDAGMAERLARAAFDTTRDVGVGLILASALIREGRFDDAEILLAGLERDAASGAERSSVTLMRAFNLMAHLDRGDEALAVLDQALEATSEPSWHLVIAGVRANLLGASGRPDAAVEAGRLILKEDAPDRAVLEAYLAAGLGLIYTGRPHEAIALMDRHLPVIRRSIDETLFGPESMGPPFHRFLAALLAGALTDATSIAERSYAEAVEHEIDWWTGTWAAAAGWSWIIRGRPATGVRWLREAVMLLRTSNAFGHLPTALGGLAHGLALIGDADAAEEALLEADRATPSSLRVVRQYASLARPWVAVAHGRLSEAREIALVEASALGSMGYRVFQSMALHAVARLGEPHHAVDALAGLAQECEGEFVRLLADHAAALANSDAPRLELASARFQELDALLEAAEAATQASTAHRRQGAAAHAAATGIRARDLAARCEGARTPALADLESPELLTPREKEAVVLAARRLSNREIARQLGISVRTVDNHLHSAYSKLGVGGRTELAEVFWPHQPSR